MGSGSRMCLGSAGWWRIERRAGEMDVEVREWGRPHVFRPVA